MYSVTGDIQTETYIGGNRTPSESVAPNYGVKTCGAYCVKSGSNGSVTVYFRFFARTYGTIGATLQSALCSGTWGTTMVGTYLQGATGETWYYGTSCGDNQYDAYATLTRDGSDFTRTNAIGWYGSSGATYQSTATMTYGAPHSVNYNANGGSGAPSTQTKYYNQTLTLSTTKPTKTGYTFKGWGTSSTATTVAYAAGASYTNNAKLNLYAIWTANTYKITYNANGGSGAPSAQTKTYGTNLTLSTTKPTRTGYTFLGWSTSSTATSATYSAGGSYTANSAATLYAVWSQNYLTVNYYSNYATSSFSNPLNTVGSTKNVIVATVKYYYGTAYTNGLTNYSTSSSGYYLARTGYTATGNWGTTTSGGTLVDEDTSFATGQALAQAFGKTLVSSSQSVNIYPQWTINSYYLDVNGLLDGTASGDTSGYGTFDVYVGGTAKATSATDFYQKINYNTTYEIKNIKATTGHTYNGVSSGSLTGTMGTSNVAVQLKFTTNTYTVSYNANEGSGAPSAQTKTYGKDLTLSTTKPTRTGYTFLGWSTSSTATTATYAAGGTYTTNAAVTLYAVWEINTYTVTFNANGGSGAPSAQTKTYGVTLALSPAVPTRANYAFKGWATSSTATTATYAAGGSYTNNSAVTLYAVWWLIPFCVYASSGWKRAEKVYVYGTDGKPYLATSVTVYGADNEAHIMLL